MSADNFMAVMKEGDKWVGYHCCASHSYPYLDCYSCLGVNDFEANTLEEAIDCCENFDLDGMGYLEYGYCFPEKTTQVWLGEDKDKVCPCGLRQYIGEVLDVRNKGD